MEGENQFSGSNLGDFGRIGQLGAVGSGLGVFLGKACGYFGQGLISRRRPCPPNRGLRGLWGNVCGQGLSPKNRPCPKLARHSGLDVCLFGIPFRHSGRLLSWSKQPKDDPESLPPTSPVGPLRVPTVIFSPPFLAHRSRKWTYRTNRCVDG